MDRLPVDLKLGIFFALSDVPSLVALIQTCSSFYQAFTHSQSLIVRTVLANEIHPAVLPHAILACEATRIQPWSKSSVREFLERYNELLYRSWLVTYALSKGIHPRDIFRTTRVWEDSRYKPWSEGSAQTQGFMERYLLSCTQPMWSVQTLAEASQISKMHDHVQFFTEDFCASTLLFHPITRALEHTYQPPSTNEVRRIQIALYRFELYCSLFRIKGDFQNEEDRFSLEEQQSLLFISFRPWENEQLGCIHDYLFQILSVPFDYMVEHDVKWAVCWINIADDFLNPDPSKGGLLSKGLGFLRSVSMAKTYEERAMVLTVPWGDHNFLVQGLRDWDDDPRQGGRQFQPAEISILPEDSDSGPRNAWYWANNLHPFYYENEKFDLREWGYCLWDKARLKKWGLFRKPWTNRRWLEMEEKGIEENSEHNKRWRRTSEERRRIWLLGERGWWDEEDESKIVWTRGTPAEQQRRAEDEIRAGGCRVHGPEALREGEGSACPLDCQA